MLVSLQLNTVQLRGSHQERMISFVSVEESQPGEVTATLRLDSNLGRLTSCDISQLSAYNLPV